jgi:hypothetical protein
MDPWVCARLTSQPWEKGCGGSNPPSCHQEVDSGFILLETSLYPTNGQGYQISALQRAELDRRRSRALRLLSVLRPVDAQRVVEAETQNTKTFMLWIDF